MNEFIFYAEVQLIFFKDNANRRQHFHFPNLFPTFVPAFLERQNSFYYLSFAGAQLIS